MPVWFRNRICIDRLLGIHVRIDKYADCNNLGRIRRLTNHYAWAVELEKKSTRRLAEERKDILVEKKKVRVAGERQGR